MKCRIKSNLFQSLTQPKPRTDRRLLICFTIMEAKPELDFTPTDTTNRSPLDSTFNARNSMNRLWMDSIARPMCLTGV